MRLALKLHPDSSCPAVSSIEVEVVRPGPRALELRYLVSGDLASLRLPAPAAPERTDELWRHSCFEAFLRAPAGEVYYEFNFAPSTRWAAYRFAGYRSGMSLADGLAAPRLEAKSDARLLAFDAALDLAPLADLAADGPWRLGLSAIIEDAEGAVAYWALAHPAGKADFHHPDCFAGQVEATQR